MVAWSAESGEVSPLLYFLEGWHSKVIVAKADNPLLLVEFLLALMCSPKVVFSLLAAHSVNSSEVLEQFCSLLAVADKEYVLYVVAVEAQGLEAAKPLVTSAFVVLPDLVAVQAALTAAYLTAVTRTAVDSSPKLVPLALGHELGKGGQA